jgi:hypothetical protein
MQKVRKTKKKSTMRRFDQKMHKCKCKKFSKDKSRCLKRYKTAKHCNGNYVF